jgi:hypothetical protein
MEETRMSTEELDQIVGRIIQEAGGPLTLLQIERRLPDSALDADTFDVQRSVQRLVDSGRARITSQFLIASNQPRTQGKHPTVGTEASAEPSPIAFTWSKARQKIRDAAREYSDQTITDP